MLNVYQITHKYAPYTTYIESTMPIKEMSAVIDAIAFAFYQAQGQSHEDTVGPPELTYLLKTHYGCREVVRAHWLRTSARHRKELDIYWVVEKRHDWRMLGESCEEAVKRLVPQAALADIANLRTLMKPWYDTYELGLDDQATAI